MIIEVSASAFEVAVCRGHAIVSRRRIMLDRGEWPTTWTSGLDELKGPLTEAVAALACAGQPTTIVYSLPGTFVSVSACPGAAGVASAIQAAKLSLASVATFPLDANPHDVRVLHEDPKPSKRAKAPAEGSPAPTSVPIADARVHTVAAAEADARIAALSLWAEAAGLKVDSVVPAEVVITAAAAAAVTSPGGGIARAVLWMGQYQSVLAVGTGGRLDLVRTVGAGTETLVEALLRPIRGRAAAGTETEPATITLDRAAARRLMNGVGIPTAQQALPDLPGCDGSSVLPLLQPVLQRLAIEIKQSLRFGMNEASKSGLSLRIAGDGAGVPKLCEILTRQAGIGMAPPPPLPPSPPQHWPSLR